MVIHVFQPDASIGYYVISTLREYVNLLLSEYDSGVIQTFVRCIIRWLQLTHGVPNGTVCKICS